MGGPYGRHQEDSFNTLPNNVTTTCSETIHSSYFSKRVILCIGVINNNIRVWAVWQRMNIFYIYTYKPDILLVFPRTFITDDVHCVEKGWEMTHLSFCIFLRKHQCYLTCFSRFDKCWSTLRRLWRRRICKSRGDLTILPGDSAVKWTFKWQKSPSVFCQSNLFVSH